MKPKDFTEIFIFLCKDLLFPRIKGLLNKYLAILTLFCFLTPLSSGLVQINNPNFYLETSNTYTNFSGYHEFSSLEKGSNYISLNNSELYLTPSSITNVTILNYSTTGDAYHIRVFGTTLNITHRVKLPAQSYLFLKDSADDGSLISNGSRWVSKSLSASGTAVFYWSSTSMAFALSWWNSKTGDNQLYVPQTWGESISYKLLFTGMLSTVWVIDGVLDAETSDTYTDSFGKGLHHVQAYGVTAGGNTEVVEWRVPVKNLMAVLPVDTINQSNFDTLKDASQSYDLRAFIEASILPYSDLVGAGIFYLFVFLIIFSMIWIRQGSLTIPGILGMILGSAVINYIPEEYRIYAQAIILLSGAALLAKLYLEGR